jgi:hypothetical protein
MSGFDPTQLLELMKRDPGAGREAVQAALMERASADPRMGALMGLLTQKQAEVEPRPATSRGQRIRRRILEMREELATLQEVNDDLAAALGACVDCWGRVRGCRTCRGRGRPGWQAPDPHLFDEMVAPACARHASERGVPPTTPLTKGEN